MKLRHLALRGRFLFAVNNYDWGTMISDEESIEVTRKAQEVKSTTPLLNQVDIYKSFV